MRFASKPRVVLALFAAFTTFACQPLGTSTDRDLTPDATGIVSIRTEAGESIQSLTQFGMGHLPPGRYAIFGAAEAPQNRAAITTFDADKECATPAAATDGGASEARDAGASAPGKADVNPIRPGWACDARGIFAKGTDGKVAVFTIPEGAVSNDAHQVMLSALGDVTFITLKALDGRTLTPPIKLTVQSEGGGCNSAEPPKVDAVDLQD